MQTTLVECSFTVILNRCVTSFGYLRQLWNHYKYIKLPPAHILLQIHLIPIPLPELITLSSWGKKNIELISEAVGKSINFFYLKITLKFDIYRTQTTINGSSFYAFNRRNATYFSKIPSLLSVLLNIMENTSKSISQLIYMLSLIHIWRCRRSTLCRSRWSPYH